MPAKTAKPAAKRTKKTASKKAISPSSINTDRKFWKLIYDENSVSEEKLNKTAFIENDRPYTYRQFFRRWENCAEVFTGLGITRENHSRIGILMVPCVDALSVIYGANMTGVSVSAITEFDFINVDRLIETLKLEKITDFVIDSTFIRPGILRQIVRRKKECGLNNIILVRLSYKVTKYFSRMEKEIQDMKYRQLKNVPGVLDMHALLVRYEATPFQKSEEMDDAAYIVHTSGTTKGIHKPIPLSDRAVNESVRRILDDPAFDKLRGGTLAFSGFLASAYHMLYEINMPLAAGCTIVFLPFSRPGPNNYRAIKDYHVTLLVTGQIVFYTWFYPFRDNKDFDLSSLEYVVLGGDYIPGKKRKEFNDFIAEKGGHAKVAVGYGLSEAGGAAILSAPGVEDDTIGRPMIGVKVKIQDETDDRFYDIADGPRSGGLYISSATNSSGKLDDTAFFETETIDGEEYICTYDRVTVGEDGSLTCHGRMNRFFVNNEGIKFDAGLIEVSLNREADIEECAVVPGYNKDLHDTVPVLYVKTDTKGPDSGTAVERALYNVFVKDGKAEETNLPVRCVICDELPHNKSGKVDIFKIINDSLKGEEYAVVAVRIKGEVKDVKLLPAAAAERNPGTLPKEMEEEFRSYTLPFFRELEKMGIYPGGENNMKPDFKNRMPVMGCNPADYDDDPEDRQNPYDAFRKPFRRPQMGCNPNEENEEDDRPSPRYNPARLPFRMPRMGCNPFIADDEDDD